MGRICNGGLSVFKTTEILNTYWMDRRDIRGLRRMNPTDFSIL